MKTINLGELDRLVRIAIAMMLLVSLRVAPYSRAGGELAVAVIALLGLTALWGFCPIDLLLGIDTTRRTPTPRRRP